jgi:hypothetical protein
VPLIGHYLRATANPIVNIERSSSVYGTMEMTESTRSMVNFYDWGTVSGMPYFHGTSLADHAAISGRTGRRS